MSIKRTLGKIVLAGTIGFGLSSCSGKVNDSAYNFTGEIDNEQITFESLPGQNHLTVKKEDGKTIIYIDNDNDLKLDEYIIKGIKLDELHKFYDDYNPTERLIKEKEFDDYIKKIIRYKQKEDLEPTNNKYFK